MRRNIVRLVAIFGLVCVADSRLFGKETRDNQLNAFSKNVLLHVVLHEMGHAVVREFDLPILANEETLADAFATCYLTRFLPEKSAAVLEARVQSLMVEASEVPRKEWPVSGEHNNDARRAYQIAALGLAADPEKHMKLAKLLNMSDREVAKAIDYGAEIHRSWRRILRPILMPEGMPSKEASIGFDAGSPFAEQINSSSLYGDLKDAVQRFDWHSHVKIFFIEGDGGAAWNRGQRTIFIRDGYVQRFIEQASLVN